jgi:predicted short-subunit dehydrogenase-like oxidoreductase (DUF2520 family)
VRPRIAILGAGAAGAAIGRALRLAGRPVAAVCRRDRARARAAARLVGGGARAFTDAARAARGADLVLVAARDGEIAALALRLARAGAVAPGALVVHLSGAVPSTALAPLRAAGARTAALHPLQTFAGAPPDLRGVRWFHEGDARRECAALVRRLGGRLRPLDPARKALYHAAAVAASNYLVAVEDLAVRLAAGAGIPPREALRALLPLVRGTVRNLEARGLPDALTGPVARGDAETVRRHRAALRALDPALDALYAALGRHALRVARERGLDAGRAGRMGRVLRAGRGAEAERR